jgi:hypothetical protein|nr:MAG TPA: trimeric autotransporter adhesin [Caudoviricetes sp.]
MIDFGILITGGIGLITTIVSSWASWFFARKKYNSEVDSNLINNMKESLDFYERLSADNRERLEEVLKRNTELEQEVRELRKQLFNLMSSICTDLTCQLRKRNLNLFNEHGISSGQKMEETELHNK